MIEGNRRWAMIGFLFFLICGHGAWARTLIVSDIDDTLKISRVRDPIGRIILAARTDRAFIGMAELFRGLLRDPSMDLVYLSNAPAWLMEGSHRQFLQAHGFPAGPVFLRKVGDSREDYKRNVLTQLIKEGGYSQVILIGDNGERDPETFEEIRQAFPEVDVRSFIHAIYRENRKIVPFNSSLRPYVTAYDLAVLLGCGTESGELERIVRQALLGDLRGQGGSSQVAPEWIHCPADIEKFWIALTQDWQQLLGAACEQALQMGRLNF